jgi:hypothetical protein
MGEAPPGFLREQQHQRQLGLRRTSRFGGLADSIHYAASGILYPNEKRMAGYVDLRPRNARFAVAYAVKTDPAQLQITLAPIHISHN